MPQFPVIIDQPGPLPISAQVQWPSSNLVTMAVSASAFAQNANTPLAVTVTIAGTTLETLKQLANPGQTHLAFPTAFISVNGGAGEFTLTLSAANGATLTDENDRFTVALLY